jgi:hypothetical protein
MEDMFAGPSDIMSGMTDTARDTAIHTTIDLNVWNSLLVTGC